jgi:cytosine/adenosine deaminase-related metal-dependent hydrolase
LNLFEEMRAFLARSSEVSPDAVLRMATMNGARALGRTGELGELTAGALADFIVIPHGGSPAQAIEAVVNFKGEVSASMINGRWVFGEIPAAR